jgi:hypothetical protein
MGEFFWPISVFISSKQNYVDEEVVNTLIKYWVTVPYHDPVMLFLDHYNPKNLSFIEMDFLQPYILFKNIIVDYLPDHLFQNER